MDKKIFINFIYNAIFQLLSIFLPFITTPYLSKVLGAEGIGEFTYVFSIIYFFSAIGMFGLNQYGSREVSYVRDKKEILNNKFISLWIIQLIICIMVILIYIYVFVYKAIYGYQILFGFGVIYLISITLDISWFYIGLEEFKKTVIRNLIIKILTLILIIILVKKPSDVYLYIILVSLSNLIANLTLWIYIPKFGIKIIPLRKLELKVNIYGAFLLFIPQIFNQIYMNLDKTIIGNIIGAEMLGYYTQSQKLARISLTVVTSLAIVMAPRISHLFKNNKVEQIEQSIAVSVNFTLGVALFITASISGVAPNFVPWFFGANFVGITDFVMLCSLIIIFYPIGSIFANQYAVPAKLTRIYTFPIIIGALISVVLNLILTYKFGIHGAIFTCLFTEFTIAGLRVFLIRKHINLKNVFHNLGGYILSAIIVFGLNYTLSNLLTSSFINTILILTTGGLTYVIIVSFFDNQLSIILWKLIKQFLKAIKFKERYL